MKEEKVTLKLYISFLRNELRHHLLMNMLIIKKQIIENKINVFLDEQLIWTGNTKTGSAQIENTSGYEKYSKAKWTEIDYSQTPDVIHIKAKLVTKPTSEGGRQTGFISGYRPNHVFEYENGKLKNTWIGDIRFEGQELIMPGEEVLVNVRFLFHTPIEKHLFIGRKWWLHEGKKIIGEGEVLEINLPNGKARIG